MNEKKSTLKPKELKATKRDSKASSQSSKIEKIKRFLNQNKIFFETIAATTLTVMAVTVAIAQLIVTNEQTVYLEQQTIIERSQASPRFTLQAKQFMNEDGTFAEDEKLLLYNHGNIAYNIQIDTAEFFELTYSYKNKSKALRVPISYYSGHIYTGDSTGLIVTASGFKNNLKRFTLQNQLDDLIPTNGKTISIDVKRYAEISYTDIFNVNHIEYYFVPTIYGGKLMETSEGKAIFEEYNNGRAEGIMLDIDNLTPEMLYNLFQ